MCAVPRAFPAFPYEPYPIQQDFMQALYDTIDKGQIGLFESPTGAAWSVTLLVCTIFHVEHSLTTNKKSATWIQQTQLNRLCRDWEDPESDMQQPTVVGGLACS